LQLTKGKIEAVVSVEVARSHGSIGSIDGSIDGTIDGSIDGTMDGYID